MFNFTVLLSYLLAPPTFYTLLSGLLAVSCAVTTLPGTSRSTLGLPLALHAWLRPPAALTALVLIGLEMHEGGINALGSTMICGFAGAYMAANGHHLISEFIGPPPEADEDGSTGEGSSSSTENGNNLTGDNPTKLQALRAELAKTKASVHLAYDAKKRAITDLNNKIEKLQAQLAAARNQPMYRVEAHGVDAVHAAAQGPAWNALTAMSANFLQARFGKSGQQWPGPLALPRNSNLANNSTANNRSQSTSSHDFIPAAAVEKDPSSNFVDLSNSPAGEASAPATAPRNNNVTIQEGSTTPKELAERAAAASAATATATAPDATAATDTAAAPGATASTAATVTPPTTPARTRERVLKDQQPLFPPQER